MLVDQTKTAVAVREIRQRSGIWLGSAAVPLIATFVGLALCLLFATDQQTPLRTAYDFSMLGCCALFGCVLPAAATVLVLLKARHELARAGAIETLLHSTDGSGRLDRPKLEARLGKARVEGALTDALALGALLPSPSAPSRRADVPLPETITRAQPEPRASERVARAPITPIVAGAPPAAEPPPSTQTFTRSPTLDDTLSSTLVREPGAPSPSALSPPLPARPLDAPDPDGLIGRTVGGTWLVESVLAAGGMGCVYVARHVRTGKRYALKTLLPDERISLESLHRFEREAKTASSLGHSGIVQVHDFDLEGDPRYLVMDRLVGETLEQRLARRGRLSWPEAKVIALEVASALDAAHRAGVLHRDLKPSNVMLAEREGLGEHAVLLDFGLAKPIREGASVWVTRTGAIVGTAHYMSPEQARGERDLDERTDVYGLGALLFEMIAGIPPFLGATPFAVLTSLLTEAPVPPSQLVEGVPPALDALVVQLLAKHREARPASVAEVARALEPIP